MVQMGEGLGDLLDWNSGQDVQPELSLDVGYCVHELVQIVSPE